ncbi:Os07g0646950 [Oryza sativa Japonica Group]|uniref:Os07g0646950 protein n=1 Tax=Oryza sativa subsp. japonica TaxID=39947 RepID=A0A0P0X9Q3_ORYSJ|nr:Os07g0646950 [Oryza sativa Japonica Group]
MTSEKAGSNASARVELGIHHSGGKASWHGSSDVVDLAPTTSGKGDRWIWPSMKHGSPWWCPSIRRRWRDGSGEGVGPQDPRGSLLFPVTTDWEAASLEAWPWAVSSCRGFRLPAHQVVGRC